MISSEASTTQNARSTRLLLAGLTLILGLGGAGWCFWQVRNQPPTFDAAIELADAGKFDEATDQIRTYLASRPDDSTANLLLAQMILRQAAVKSKAGTAGSVESGRLAMEHLDRVHASNRTMATTYHLCRGNALDRMLRLDEAEQDWLAALKEDPSAPEVGWNLLNLYYLQGRQEEARRLGLRLFEVEPDPHDRALLLLELLRHDARPPAPGSVLNFFEPVIKANPGELNSALAIGLATTRAGQVEKGIDVLQRIVRAHPDRIEAIDTLLAALDESGQLDAMEEEFEKVSGPLADSPQLFKHRARLEQGKDWKKAVDLYRRAQAAEPFNRVIEYRLSRALRHINQNEEADRIEERLRRRDLAIQELRPLFDRASELRDLGGKAHADLCQSIADVREKMQLPDEARAWHQLVLKANASNAVSLAALARLKTEERQP